jgi:hypothetical protein
VLCPARVSWSASAAAIPSLGRLVFLLGISRVDSDGHRFCLHCRIDPEAGVCYPALLRRTSARPPPSEPSFVCPIARALGCVRSGVAMPPSLEFTMLQSCRLSPLRVVTMSRHRACSTLAV